MGTFNFNEYQTVVNRAQANSANKSNAVKVGFFKLKNNGDEALVRFNVGSLDDLQFAAVHQLGAANKWMKVSCLSPIGSRDHSDCPLCKAAETDNSIGKAAKRVYVQLMVAYKDPTTGSFAQVAAPVIWERPAGFANELSSLLRDYDGDLRKHVFKVTRNGAAGSMQTTYSIAFIPLYDTVNAVTNDFSAFNNFNIAKHSYWEKTKEDIETFLATGSFPEVEKPAKSDNLTTLDSGIKVGGAPVFANAAEEAAADAALNGIGHTAIGTNNVESHTAIGTAESAEATTTTTEERPVRNFNNGTGRSFKF